MKKKTRLATVWLDGCSGCHMSLLDMDEALVPLAAQATLFTGRWWTRRNSRRPWTSPWWRAPSAARTIWRKRG